MAEIGIVEARTELSKALRMFKAFEKADGVLGMLESAEQLTREMSAAADKAKAETEAARVALDKLMRQSAKAREEMEAETAANARRVNEAKAEAAGIVREARRVADELAADAAGKVAAATSELSALKAQRSTLATEVANLEARILQMQNIARGLIAGV